MRISSRLCDFGYMPSAGAIRVLLDGVERRDVHTADEERGEIYRYLRGDDDGLLIDPVTHELKSERMTGTVAILLPAHLQYLRGDRPAATPEPPKPRVHPAGPKGLYR